MYVAAPKKPNGGSITVNNSIPFTMHTQNTSGYPSLGEALGKAYTFTGTQPYGSTGSIRSAEVSGRISWNRFRNTAYSSHYWSARAQSPIVLIKRRRTGGREYYAETLYARVNGTGGFKTGVTVHHVDLDPNGSSPFALLNKLAVANLKARALAEAKNKLSENDLDFAEALAGLDKTVMMIAERAAQVMLAYRQARRGDYKAVARTLGITRRNLNFSTPAKAWLELQYGWTPLLSDIYNGMTEANYMLRQPDGQVVAVRRVQEELLTRPAVPAEGGNDSWQDHFSTHRGTASVEVKFKARVNNAVLNYLSSVQLTNPLYLAWVNLPMSFVVDWLMPVGDWLSSITAPLGLTFVSGYRTTRIWGEWSFTATGKGIQQPLLYEPVQKFGSASGSYGQANLNREVFSSWPIEGLYFRFPFRSVERVLNASALIAANMRLR